MQWYDNVFFSWECSIKPNSISLTSAELDSNLIWICTEPSLYLFILWFADYTLFFLLEWKKFEEAQIFLAFRYFSASNIFIIFLNSKRRQRRRRKNRDFWFIWRFTCIGIVCYYYGNTLYIQYFIINFMSVIKYFQFIHQISLANILKLFLISRKFSALYLIKDILIEKKACMLWFAFTHICCFFFIVPPCS